MNQCRIRQHRPGGVHAVSGFSMIEILIALVVLALGLLGFALLQTMSLRYTQSANERTQATNLAYDLLDQMRANRLSASDYQNATFAAGDVSAADCVNRPTGTVTWAQSIERWQCQVFATLGADASATVTYIGGEAVVTLNWGERLAAGPDETQFIVRTRL